MATVLRFEHEVIMSGRSLPRPTNYSLSRIVPLPDVVIDPCKRPVVVIDPRAGQGPGIGGFKADSEIGDALAAGHPVYFIGFGAEPVAGQQFLDVVEGEVKLFEKVVALHPDAPRPFAIGNCQAGYQTLMGAALRPDLYGPCLVAGSPLSYWQGVRGKNPMRYSGGLLGGSWLTALASDLGNGKFDGTALIQNFKGLDPGNWLWGKQYDVYAHIDTGAERYLNFEKWWGDFIQLGGDEIQFLVDNLFIGDKLTRNELQAQDGTTFDLRNITSPIIVFTSMGDDISPPPQALGWIIDLYRDVDAIRASGRTIVYCVNQEVGHLGLFVSSRVGAKEDEEFVQLMDIIDCLPPGLHEMVLEPRPTDPQDARFVTGEWTARFELRTLDDIRVLGRNSPEDDRAFAAAARLSERNLALYRSFAQPLVRAVVTEQGADWLRKLNPLRLGYSLFSDANPLMWGVHTLAANVAAERKPVAEDNRLLALQEQERLRTGRLISHCAMISVPTYARRVIVTDAALNIAPDTDQKRDICQNAIGCARALGVDTPKVAVLAAVEMVRTRMPATLDGAILAKMTDRRQIVDGIVDGPLDLDAAVDAEAARIKNIVSPVAGAADVLLAPNIEAGNLVYKNLGFMADAQTAGLVVGARVPVIVTSRADTAATRAFSAAAAVLYADAIRHDPTILQPEVAE